MQNMSEPVLPPCDLIRFLLDVVYKGFGNEHFLYFQKVVFTEICIACNPYK